MSHPLLDKLRRRDATVGIIGLGYVGLPLALAFHRAGFRVRGFDIDPKKPSALKAGQSYIRHIPQAEVAELPKSGRFDATTDYSRTSECDALVICVPTPLTKSREPDMSYIVDTCASIQPHMKRGQLIVLEFSQPTAPGLKPLYDAYSFKLLPMLGKLVAGDADSYRYLAESIRRHPDQETLLGMMREAGLEDCRYHNLSGGIVAVHRGYRY